MKIDFQAKITKINFKNIKPFKLKRANSINWSWLFAG